MKARALKRVGGSLVAALLVGMLASATAGAQEKKPAPVVAVPMPVLQEAEPPPVSVFEYGPEGLTAAPPARPSLEDQGLGPSDLATVVAHLEHVSPAEVLQTLTSVIPGRQGSPQSGTDFRAGLVAGGPRVVLTGQVRQIDHALRILRIIDVPDAPEKAEEEAKPLVKIFTLKHADVNELSQVLMRLHQTQVRPIGVVGTQFVVDQRTQKLIVRASTQEDLDAVSLLVEELDVPVERPELHTRVLPLAHIDGEEAASVLEHLLDLSQAAAVSRGRPLRTGRTPTSVRRFSPGEGRILVQEETGSLLVRATAEQFEAIEEILKLIDVSAQEDGETAPLPVHPAESGNAEAGARQ
jgi:hypothetical protein